MKYFEFLFRCYCG